MYRTCWLAVPYVCRRNNLLWRQRKVRGDFNPRTLEGVFGDIWGNACIQLSDRKQNSWSTVAYAHVAVNTLKQSVEGPRMCSRCEVREMFTTRTVCECAFPSE